MNDLSWALYLADILGTLGWFFAFLAIVGGAAVVASVFMKFYTFSYEFEREDNNQQTRFKKFIKILAFSGIPALFVFGVLASIMPEKDTMYLIVASEAGEYVINSETGQKTVAVVNAFLDQQLEELTTEQPGPEATEAAEEEQVVTPELREAIANAVAEQIRNQ